MKKIIKIIILSLVLIALVLGGFYFYSGVKAIKNTDNKWLVDYRSTKRMNNGVAGAETNLTQSIPAGSIQPSGSTNPKSTTGKSNSQQSSQTTTQPSPPSPSCNQAQKTALITLYDGYIAKAGIERDKIKNDALNQYLAELQAINQRYQDIWDPVERERLRARDRAIAAGVLADSRNMADRNYNGEVAALTLSLNTALRSINC